MYISHENAMEDPGIFGGGGGGDSRGGGGGKAHHCHPHGSAKAHMKPFENNMLLNNTLCRSNNSYVTISVIVCHVTLIVIALTFMSRLKRFDDFK